MGGNANNGAVKRPRSQSDAEAAVPKKRKRYDEKPQRVNRRTERRQLMAEAKATWEQLRPKATTKEKGSKLVNELLKLLNTRLIEFVFRHDGSRIVQWMLAEGSDTHKKTILQELMTGSEKGSENVELFIKLACDRYGHHLAFKMLRVSDKWSKGVIFERYLRGNTAHLIKNSHGADVLDFAYQTILNARQRAELVIELLYSREGKILESIRGKLFNGEGGATSGGTRNVFEESLKLVDDSFRDVVVERAGSMLCELVEKERLVGFEVIHAAVKEYLSVVMKWYAKEKAIEMAVMLAPLLVEFAHTKAGILVAVNCVKILDAKHRKKVVRGVKSHIRKLLENEYGHRLMIALFEWVDDTRLVGKSVVNEVLSKWNLDKVLDDVDDGGHKTKRGGRSKGEKKGKENLGKKNKKDNDDEGMDLEYVRDLCMHKYGRMMFVNLFFGRDTRYLNPDIYGLIWEEIDEEKFGKTSKKEASVRRNEVRCMFEESVSRVMEKYMGRLLICHWSASIVIGAALRKETREGVVRGMMKCSEDKESWKQVLNNKCGRKTIGTIVKIGDKEMCGRLMAQCDGVKGIMCLK